MATKGGINDPSALPNVVRGGTVKWYNQVIGSTGSKNSGSITEHRPADGSEWTYWCDIFSFLDSIGIHDYRGGGHDPQAWEAFLYAGVERLIEAILTMLDAARAYGVRVVLTLGGFSDTITAPRAFELFERGSTKYNQFVAMAAKVADAVKGHEALEVLELLNEPDFVTCISGYWLKKYPSGGWALINGFVEWERNIIADVRAKQENPGTPLGMGTALDSNLYCNAKGEPIMDWYASPPKVIMEVLRPCDKLTIHSYVNENSALHRDVWAKQKIVAFLAAAKALGKRLIIGETGGLWAGGIYDSGMEATLSASGAVYLWMVRWWDPKVFTIPTSYPERYPKEPEPPVEEPEDEMPEKGPKTGNSEGEASEGADIPPDPVESTDGANPEPSEPLEEPPAPEPAPEPPRDLSKLLEPLRKLIQRLLILLGIRRFQ